jgi:hypothetical protein
MHLLPDALQSRVAVLDVRGRTLPAPGAYFPNADADYFLLLSRAQTTTALVWEGNQHNSRFLLVDPPFTVVGPERRLPECVQEPVVPYRMVRALFELDLQPLELFLASHPDPASVFVLGTPPPKAEAELRAGLAKEFRRRLDSYGLTPEEAPLLDAATRVASWKAIQESMASIAERAGATFVRVPAAARNEDGTLRAELCASDATHSNADYGVLMWRELFKAMEVV